MRRSWQNGHDARNDSGNSDLVGVLCGLCPIILMAQASAPAVLDLSLQQAIEMALAPDRNTRLMLADEMVRASEAR